VLADLTGVPDLYQRMGPVMRGLLRGRWHQPEATALKTWARVVVIAWVLVVVPLMAVSLLLMVLALPRLLATAWTALGQQVDRLASDVGDGDVLGVLTRLLAIVALVVPLLGIGYVLVERGTGGRPVPEAVTGLPVVVAGEDLELYRVPGATGGPAASPGRVIGVVLAHAWALGTVMGAVLWITTLPSTVTLRRRPLRKRVPE